MSNKGKAKFGLQDLDTITDDGEETARKIAKAEAKRIRRAEKAQSEQKETSAEIVVHTEAPAIPVPAVELPEKPTKMVEATWTEVLAVVPQEEPFILPPELLEQDEFEVGMNVVLAMREEAHQKNIQILAEKDRRTQAEKDLEKVKMQYLHLHEKAWKAFLAAHPGMENWIGKSDKVIVNYRKLKETEIDLVLSKTNDIAKEYIQSKEELDKVTSWINTHAFDHLKKYGEAEVEAKKFGIDYNAIWPRKEVRPAKS